MDRYNGELLAAQSAYQAKGLKAGGKSLPATTASPFDANETQLKADAQRFVLNEDGKLKQLEGQKRKVLGDMQNNLSTVSADCDALLDDESLTDTALSGLEHERRALIELREKVLVTEADLNSYRQLNNITDEAVYPENSAAPYVWLVPVVLIETLLNAVFYENANGLLGGFVVAFTVSLLNIGCAFAMGALFRYKNLSHPSNKLLGYFCLASAVIIAVYANALFSAFRTEYSLLDDPTDYRQSSEAFLSSSATAARVFLFEMPASDLTSFLLFFLGLGLSALAFWKGMGVDDRHPGYGKRARALKAKELAYSALVDGVTDKVSHELKAKNEKIATAKAFLMQAQASLQQVKTALEVERRKTLQNLTQIQRDFAHVLDVYRQSNVSVRATNPPEYFSETPDLVAAYIADIDDTFEPIVLELDAEISTLKASYVVRLTEKLKLNANEARAILGKTVTAFLEGVTEDAKKNINLKLGKMPQHKAT